MAKPILAEQHYTCTVCGCRIVQTFTASATRVVHWGKDCAAWNNPQSRPSCMVLALRGQRRLEQRQHG